MATDLADGFTPPDEEDPTQYRVEEIRIKYTTPAGITLTAVFSYGKDDGAGGYQRIRQERDVTWPAADVVAAVTSPDPGAVNADLLSIVEQMLLSEGYVEV